MTLRLLTAVAAKAIDTFNQPWINHLLIKTKITMFIFKVYISLHLKVFLKYNTVKM